MIKIYSQLLTPVAFHSRIFSVDEKTTKIALSKTIQEEELPDGTRHRYTPAHKKKLAIIGLDSHRTRLKGRGNDQAK